MWAEDKEDMYPQWKTQRENEQPNAPKIKGDCDSMGGMEELTNETVSIVLSPGFPARDKDIIASWESRIDGEGKSDHEDHINEEDKVIEGNQEKPKAYKQLGENKSPKIHKENMARRMMSKTSEAPRDERETRESSGHLLLENELGSEPNEEPLDQTNNNVESTYTEQSHQSSEGGESKNRLFQLALTKVITCLLFVVSVITASTSAIYQIQHHSRKTYINSAVKREMGKSISKETVEIVNNQLNSNEQLKAHINEAMESHRNIYVSATVIVLIVMMVVLLTLYACSKYCLLRCKESINDNNRDVSHYNSRSPYPGYTNHLRRFSNRFAEVAERGQIRNGEERAEAGEVGLEMKSHGVSGSRIRTSEFN